MKKLLFRMHYQVATYLEPISKLYDHRNIFSVLRHRTAFGILHGAMLTIKRLKTVVGHTSKGVWCYTSYNPNNRDYHNTW